MTNFPGEPPKSDAPGRPKPKAADAVGEGDASELVDMDEGDLRGRLKRNRPAVDATRSGSSGGSRRARRRAR